MDDAMISAVAQERAEVDDTRRQLQLRLAQIDEAVAVEGVTVEGSRGQLRPHPLLAIERGIRRDLERLARRAGELDTQLAKLRELQEERERVERMNSTFRNALAPMSSNPALAGAEATRAA